MSEKTNPVWSSWNQLSEPERQRAVQQTNFWSTLSDTQKESFLAEADWQEIRADPEAQQAYLDRLLPAVEVSKRLGLDDLQLAFLMSTRQLPGALVNGQWLFDWLKVWQWVQERGGLGAVREDVQQQLITYYQGQK